MFSFSSPTPEDTEGYEDLVFLESDPEAPIIDVSTDTSDEVLADVSQDLGCDVSLPGSSLVVVGDGNEIRGLDDLPGEDGPPMVTVKSEVYAAATLLNSLKSERASEASQGDHVMVTKSLDSEAADVQSSRASIPVVTLDDTLGSSGSAPDEAVADSSVQVISPNSSGNACNSPKILFDIYLL